MKIAFFSTKSYDKQYFDKNNTDLHDITYFETRLTDETIHLCDGSEAVCVFVNDRINNTVIKYLSSQDIHLILLRCAGFNNVDLRSANERGISVFRVQGYSPRAVAEHALALILTLNRKTHKAYNRIREMNFSLERLIGFDIYNKTIGVIGTGKIGSAFCRIMLGFGCRILAYDIYEQEDLKSIGIQYTSLDNCFEQSDIISLHCPLNSETKYLINRERIGKMKDGVMLINTSRGALINTRDIIDGLKHQKIGYLGIDVYEQEDKLFFEDFSEIVIQDDIIARLLTFPNVLITSHQGFLTHEALDNISQITFENIASYLRNKISDNLVSIHD